MSALWDRDGRAALPESLARDWDMLVIGGGITGAGILLEASRRGLKALLVEQRDFAWGTSSRSSKLVHGGLRYLKEGRLALTRESVREREHLLHAAAGLVEPQSFAFGDYAGRKPGKRAFLLGLAIYDRMAGGRVFERDRHGHHGHSGHYVEREAFAALAPNLATEGLRGGIVYGDAKTDDARLVLRVLQEARAHGAVAVNYMAVESLLRGWGDEAGMVAAAAGTGAVGGMAAAGRRVRGALLHDGVSGERHTVRARMVVNATGAWADRLRMPAAVDSAGTTSAINPANPGSGPRLRPLRGSHLVLPAWRLPLAQAVSLMHPSDGRPVFAFPWEGVTLVGTTDVDHRDDLAREASITRAEVDYLMAALRTQFPRLELKESDIIASYAGVRPVIGSGKADPSSEGRDHALWLEDGLLTVTGGKLTTFRVIALDALRALWSFHAQGQAAPPLPEWDDKLEAAPVFAPAPALLHHRALPAGQALRLQGRYGALAAPLIAAAAPGELETIAGTQTLWAQLRWAARHEAVQRLEDLLLRRSRVGIQLRGGGVEILGRVRAICQPELGWSDARWESEQADYLALWRGHYSPPRPAMADDAGNDADEDADADADAVIAHSGPRQP